MPQLSIILANYNHAKFLPECLDAILDQSYSDWELVIIDDCSTDHSVEIIKTYDKQSPNLKFYENEQNIGPVKSYNRGFGISQGAFIFFASADDMVLPGFFEKMILFFTENPPIGLCTSYMSRFQNQKPYVHYTKMDMISDTPLILSPNEVISYSKKNIYQIPGHATIYRRELVQKYGGYDATLHGCCDWYLNLQIALNHPIGYLPYFFSSGRINNQSYWSHSSNNRLIRNEMYSNLLNKIKSNSGFRKKILKSNVLIQFNSSFLKHCLLKPSTWPYLFPLLVRLPIWIYKQYTKKTLIRS